MPYIPPFIAITLESYPFAEKFFSESCIATSLASTLTTMPVISFHHVHVSSVSPPCLTASSLPAAMPMLELSQ
jgi:hypothetical protein